MEIFNWDWLTVCLFVPLSPSWETQWHISRHGAGELVENSKSVSAGIRKIQ